MYYLASSGIAGEIINLIINAIKDFAAGVGSVIVDVFNSVALQTVEGVTTLTPFAIWTLVFLGVSLTIGVITAILRKVG